MAHESKLKVLLVEDNPGDARLIQIMIQDSGQFRPECIKASKLEQALEMLKQDIFDIILLDLALPDSFGLETFTRIKHASPDTPIVVLTGNDDETIALSAVREGAQDYIVKGQFDEKQLNRAIHYAIERQKTVLQLHTMSFMDELTGLSNRRGFMIQADKLLKLGKRETGIFAVFFIDLDGMKYINDTYGHAEGDKALKDMADIMRSCFREADVSARLGGDEFAAAMLLESVAAAEPIRERFQDKINKLNASGLREYTLSASVGWAFCDETCYTLEGLLQSADEIMYNEKRKRGSAR